LVLARHKLDEAGDGSLVQAGERKPRRGRLARQLGQRRCERLAHGWVDIPVGGDKEHAAVRELAGEELEQEEGRRVGRVQVVQDEHERAILSRAAQEVGGSLEEAEAGAFRLELRRLGQAGEELAQLRQELRELRRSRAQLRPQRWGLRLADADAQRLHPRPEGGSAARLPAAADEDARAPCSRPAEQLVREPALADTGLPDEQKEASMAGKGVVEAHQQLFEFALAADEDTAARIGASGLELGRQVERRILAEDRLLQLAQLPPRLDAELLNEHSARVVVDLERLRVTTRAIQGEHQLRGCSFLVRMLGDERLELADELRVTPELELGVDPLELRREP
jgi:hypothetical protein